MDVGLIDASLVIFGLRYALRTSIFTLDDAFSGMSVYLKFLRCRVTPLVTFNANTWSINKNHKFRISASPSDMLVVREPCLPIHEF